MAQGPRLKWGKMTRRPWPGIFMAGFECASQKLASGERLDLAAGTGHLRFPDEDYAAIAALGLRAARDGFRWHEIERRPRRYDWSSALSMIRAAEKAGISVIWDLCHYGVPNGLDIASSAFVERFAAYAGAAAVLLRDECRMPLRLCPINEISFWAWAGGDQGTLNPFWQGRGDELKRQLVRAALAAIEAVRAVAPEVEIVTAEPLIHVASAAGRPEYMEAAEHYHVAQYQAVDMLLGRMAPELGGYAGAVNCIGVNYYPDNQWMLGGGTIPLGHHDYRPLRSLLGEVSQRFALPMLITETGAEGTARAAWLHYVSAETRAAVAAGCDVFGICLYPITDYPGWSNRRHCPVGLLGFPDSSGRRPVDHEMAEELRRQQRCWIALHEVDAGVPRDLARAG
jgi:beta-glucosidase/6-phospho-beta-glucosidase/beta-galactosidase